MSLFFGHPLTLGFFSRGLLTGDAGRLIGFAFYRRAGFVFEALLFASGVTLGARLFFGDAIAFGLFPGGLLAGAAGRVSGLAFCRSAGFVFEALLLAFGVTFSAHPLFGNAFALGLFPGGLLAGAAGRFVGLTFCCGAGFIFAALLFAFGVTFNARLFFGHAFTLGLFPGGLLAGAAGRFVGLAFCCGAGFVFAALLFALGVALRARLFFSDALAFGLILGRLFSGGALTLFGVLARAFLLGLRFAQGLIACS